MLAEMLAGDLHEQAPTPKGHRAVRVLDPARADSVHLSPIDAFYLRVELHPTANRNRKNEIDLQPCGHRRRHQEPIEAAEKFIQRR